MQETRYRGAIDKAAAAASREFQDSIRTGRTVTEKRFPNSYNCLHFFSSGMRMGTYHGDLEKFLSMELDNGLKKGVKSGYRIIAKCGYGIGYDVAKTEPQETRLTELEKALRYFSFKFNGDQFVEEAVRELSRPALFIVPARAAEPVPS